MNDQVGIGYVNAYAVTRHYGGPEEGGWWYNAGRPLASVPVRVRMELHDCDDDCAARDDDGRCPHDKAAFHEQDCQIAEAWLKAQLGDAQYGNIYSMRGGQAVELRRETIIAYDWPRTRPYYE